MELTELLNSQLLSAIIGAVIGASISSFFTLYVAKRQFSLLKKQLDNEIKLRELYSRIVRILDRILNTDDSLFDISPTIENADLHNTFDQLYTRIPLDINGLNVRELMDDLLKSSKKLGPFRDNLQTRTSYEALRNLLDSKTK